MANKPKFTKKVSAGTRVYYMDVRTDTQGHEYVTITEQSVDKERPRRSTIFVHPEDMPAVMAAMEEVAARVSKR